MIASEPNQKWTVYWINNQKYTSQSPRTLTLEDKAAQNALDGLNVKELIRIHSVAAAAAKQRINPTPTK